LGQNKVAYRKSASCVVWKCLQRFRGGVGVKWRKQEIYALESLIYSIERFSIFLSFLLGILASTNIMYFMHKDV
jgi:hypothetical protein